MNAEPQRLRVKIGTQVIGADGQRIGDVDGVVLNPKNDRVRLVMIRKGLIFHSDQSFGVQSITRIDDDGIHVSFTREESEMMDHYMDADFMTPPDGYFGTNGVFWPRQNYLGAMNSEEPDMEENDPRLGSEQVLIALSRGSEVLDRDQESLGKIVDLAADAAGRIIAFKVEEGRLRHHERWVPVHCVAVTDDEHVYLNLTEAELDERLDQQAAIDPGNGFELDLDD